MYIQTAGIVLHTIKYSETSVISKIYTEKLGLVSYIVKGVRSAKSKSKAALLQPLTLLDMQVSHRENKQLQYIKEFHRAFNYQSIPFDVIKGTIALFLLEVITKSIREHEENGEMFEFIYEAFCSLDKAGKLNPDFHLQFLVHFTRYLGFAPHDNFSDQNPYFEMNEGVFTNQENLNEVLSREEGQLLSKLIRSNLFAGDAMQINRVERKQMMHNLLRYYQLHLENFSLKSPAVLEDVLED
jgi:DNA repair protein RecO (recombination protein O)